MFCPKCGSNMADGVQFCTSCGNALSGTAQSPVSEGGGQAVRPAYQPQPVQAQPAYQPQPGQGQAPYQQPAQAQPAYQQQPGGYQQQAPYAAPAPYAGQSPKSKIAAGVLGILLGGLGIHKFYLGITKPAVIMLVGWILGFILCFFLIGYFIVSALGIIGLIEGIIYLTKSDQEFYQTYVVGKKEWF